MKKNAKYNKILILISVSLIFLCGIIPEELILVIQLFLIILLKKLKMPKKFLIILLFIVIHATINIAIGNNNLALMLKQIIGISISFIFYYNIIKDNEDIDIFFNIYLKFLFAICGIIANIPMCIIKEPSPSIQ